MKIWIILLKKLCVDKLEFENNFPLTNVYYHSILFIE